MPRKKLPGIFCLEGSWTGLLSDDQSVRPLLELLEGTDQVEYIYRDVSTVEELHLLSKKWTQRQYKRFRLGYFGFHGELGALRVGRKKVTLEELGETLAGKCKGRIIHFGSCLVMKAPKARLRDFLEVTHAECVIGYTSSVEWYESCAFELLLLHELMSSKSFREIEKTLRRDYRSLTKRVGFQMHH